MNSKIQPYLTFLNIEKTLNYLVNTGKLSIYPLIQCAHYPQGSFLRESAAAKVLSLHHYLENMFYCSQLKI